MSESVNIKSLRSSQKGVQESRKSGVKEESVWDFLNRDIQLFGSGLPDKIKESFYLELGSMLKAGVDIRTSLELIQNEYKKKSQKIIFINLLNEIVAGSTLSEALKKAGKFSTYEYFTVQIGEETGKLTEVLKELAIYFNKRIKQKRQIIGALAYPVMVLSVAFGAIFFMVSYVVPMFSDIFRRSGDDLPAITKLVILFSDLSKQYSGSFFLLLVCFILLSYWQRQKTWLRKFSAQILLRLPIWGSLVQKIYLGRFCHTMSMLLGSQIPILQAIHLTKQIIHFYPFESSLQLIEETIAVGKPLHACMAQYSIYPAKMIAMVKVGEEVNQLDHFFTQLSEQYSNEIEYQTTLLSKFLEPFIIILLGVIVGIVLIAMYLPLFKLGQEF